jgi:hypothetical protein
MFDSFFGVWVAVVITVLLGGFFVVLASPLWTERFYTGVPPVAAGAFVILMGPLLIGLLVAIWRDVLGV